MSSDTDEEDNAVTATAQDDTTSYQKLTNILQNASKEFNGTILEKYDEVISDSIRNSGITDAENIADRFHEYFTKEINGLEKEHNKMMKKFKTSISRSISIVGLSTTNIDIPAQHLLNLTRFVNSISKEFVEKVLELIPSYYAEQLLDFDYIDVTMSSNASALLDELNGCEPGSEHWREYEDVCTKILSYCFTPPLLEPAIQSETEEGDQRRDIILHIPMDIERFWKYILYKYGIAVIIDCKNYTDFLNQNTFVITSKYISGPRRLTKFGMILTRKGMNESAKIQQKRVWGDVYLICLNDEDLIKMIKLKESGKEPSIIIDNKIREVLVSL